MLEQQAERARELVGESAIARLHMVPRHGGDLHRLQLLGNAVFHIVYFAQTVNGVAVVGRSLDLRKTHGQVFPTDVVRGVLHLELQHGVARSGVVPVGQVGHAVSIVARTQQPRLAAGVDAHREAGQLEARGQLIGELRAIGGLIIQAEQGRVALVGHGVDGVGDHLAKGCFLAGTLGRGVGHIAGPLRQGHLMFRRREGRVDRLLLHPLVVVGIARRVVAAVAEVHGSQSAQAGLGVAARAVTIIGGVRHGNKERMAIRLVLLGLEVGTDRLVRLVRVGEQVLAVGHLRLVDVNGDLSWLATGGIRHLSQIEVGHIREIDHVDLANLLIGQLRDIVDEGTALFGLANVGGTGVIVLHVGILAERDTAISALPSKQILGANASGGTGCCIEHEHVIDEVDLGVAGVGDVLHAHLVHGVVVAIPKHRCVHGGIDEFPLQVRLDEGGAQHVLGAVGALTARFHFRRLIAHFLGAVGVGKGLVLVAEQDGGAGIVRHGTHKAHLARQGQRARMQLVQFVARALVPYVPGAGKALRNESVLVVGHFLDGIPVLAVLGKVVAIDGIGIGEVGQALMIVAELEVWRLGLGVLLLPFGGVQGFHGAFVIEVEIGDIQLEDNGGLAAIFHLVDVGLAQKSALIGGIRLQGHVYLLARFDHHRVGGAIHGRAVADMQIGIEIGVGEFLHLLVGERLDGRRRGGAGGQERGARRRRQQLDGGGFRVQGVILAGGGGFIRLVGRGEVVGFHRVVGARLAACGPFAFHPFRALGVVIGLGGGQAGQAGQSRSSGCGCFGLLVGEIGVTGLDSGEDGTVGHALGHHHVVAGGHRRNLSIESSGHRRRLSGALLEGNGGLVIGSGHIQRAALAGLDGALAAAAGQLDTAVSGDGVRQRFKAKRFDGGSFHRIDGGDLLVGKTGYVQHDDAAFTGHANEGVALARLLARIDNAFCSVTLGLIALAHLEGHDRFHRHRSASFGVGGVQRAQGDSRHGWSLLGHLVADKMGQVALSCAVSRARHGSGDQRGRHRRRRVIRLIREDNRAGSSTLHVAILWLRRRLALDRFSSEGVILVSVVYGYEYP